MPLLASQSVLPPKDSWQQASDIDLLENAKKDSAAFGMLMTRYETPLLRYLVRFTGWAEEEVQDILQEAFIKVYRNLNDFDPSLKFSSWLYRVVHNQAVDAIRRQVSHPITNMLPIEETARLVASETNLETELTLAQDLESIRQAIAELPLHYREVLILRFLEEKDYEEIMDILKKPKGTVATLIKRGRALLLERLRISKTY